MVQASVLAVDRDIFIRPQQPEGNMKLDPQGKPLENAKNTSHWLWLSFCRKKQQHHNDASVQPLRLVEHKSAILGQCRQNGRSYWEKVVPLHYPLLIIMPETSKVKVLPLVQLEALAHSWKKERDVIHSHTWPTFVHFLATGTWI